MGVRDTPKIVRDTLPSPLQTDAGRRTIGLTLVWPTRTAARGVAEGGMGCAWGARMNSTLFSIKRGFLRTVHFGRKVLEPFGLTPARFDILYLLRDGWRRQSQIWRRLGLHPSTVCRVMVRLEDLDLVH